MGRVRLAPRLTSPLLRTWREKWANGTAHSRTIQKNTKNQTKRKEHFKNHIE